MKNIFTIDTEDWFHANYEEELIAHNREACSTVEANVDRYLELFSQYNVKATFFVLGFVADKHPDLIRKIAGEGHEIASHGYAHQLVYTQTADEFREDVRKSKTLLEDLTGEEVSGYRAPSWSITEKSLWAIEILEKEGFVYSSSIFPTQNFLYGIPYAPRFIHDSSVYGFSDLKIMHIPPATRKCALIKKGGIPFSGGAYFRLFPAGLINLWTKKINEKEKEPVVFYLHPREIDPRQPRLKLKFIDYCIHYYGIRGCEKKLKKVLGRYEFITMREMVSVCYGSFN